MKEMFKIFRSGGKNLRIHWSFLLPIIAGITIMTVHMTDARQVVWLIAMLLLMTITIGVHEMGHVLAASFFGMRASRVILLPVGSVIQFQQTSYKPVQQMIIWLAGPLANISLALLLWRITQPHPAFFLLPENMNSLPGRGLLDILRIGNTELALFNLIPAFPLDGGRVLEGMLSLRLSRERAYRIVVIMSKYFAVVLAGLSIIFYSPVLVFVSLIIILNPRFRQISGEGMGC